MTPVTFGPSQRSLYGLFHAPDAGRNTQRALLLCYPFGHETLRIHRFYRLLAERLARQGIAVMRFDAYGTGDSPGDDEEGELIGWAGDLCEAHAELLERSGASHVTWFGSRLGASIALQAAQKASPPPQALVLWDLIVDGPAYLKELQRAHVDELDMAHCIPDPQWRRSIERDNTAFAGECLGFAISPQLRSQIVALSSTLAAIQPSSQVTVIADPTNVAALKWAADLQARPTQAKLRLEEFAHPLIWTSNPFANNEMVPTQALQKMMEAVNGSS